MNRQHSGLLIGVALMLWVAVSMVVLLRMEIPNKAYIYFGQNGLPVPCGSWPGACQ